MTEAQPSPPAGIAAAERRLEPSYPVHDIWFERRPAGSHRLLLAFAAPQPPGLPAHEFEVELGDDALLRFRFIAEIKGRRVFEASGLRRAEHLGRDAPGQLPRLAGPFREWSPDAA